jgi:hypothetical protein
MFFTLYELRSGESCCSCGDDAQLERSDIEKRLVRRYDESVDGDWCVADRAEAQRVLAGRQPIDTKPSVAPW